MSEESLGNTLRGSAETKYTYKNEDDEELRSELLQDVPEWLQDFTEYLVDKNVQPHQYSPSSPRQLPMEPRPKVVPGPGEHSIFTHFPKDRKLWYVLDDKNNKGFLQKTYWYSRAQSGKFRLFDNRGSQSSQ